MTKHQIAAILARVRVLWPNSTMAPGTEDVWHEALSAEPPEGAIEAMIKIAQEDEWPPTVARFRAVRRGLTGGPLPTVETCGRCDNGWIDQSTDTHVIVAPCPNCRPQPVNVREEVPFGERLATSEQNRAGAEECRRILANGNGPLAAALRGAVRGPGPAVLACTDCGEPTSRVGPAGVLECAACAVKRQAPAMSPSARQFPDPEEPF